ncbi:MAG: caspase family protein [Holophagales bacterium]|nr:caspase family protein [Holophagales bacterium]
MRRAVLIGIDNYDTLGSLSSCCNDVTALRPLLAENIDSPNFECRCSCGGPERISRIRLSELVDETLAPGADTALFYFAGHALSRPGDVELAGQESHAPGSGFSMAEFFSRARQSTVPEIIIILDCCHAGAAGQVPQLGGGVTLVRAGISLLSACRADEAAVEDQGRGLFSSRLCAALEGAAADVLGRVDVARAYAYLSESFGAFSQRPTFLTSTWRVQELRRCAPAVAPKYLRELPRLFHAAEAELALDPGYEPSEEPGDAEKERDFTILQKCRDAKLVKPVGEEHLYFAALHSKSCKLTELGRHYWALAEAGRL